MTNQLELRHFRYFMMLAQELHYRKAAEKLFISQSALSQQIRQLEGILSVELFDRSNKKVKLTEAGIHFRKDAIQLMSKLTLTVENVELLKEGSHGELVIGFVASCLNSMIKNVVRHIHAKYPKVKFELIELTNKGQLDAMNNRELDIAFIRSNAELKGMHVKLVHEEHFVLALPKGHPISQKNFKSLDQFKEEDFILFPNDKSQMYYQQIISLCGEHGFFPKIAHKAIHAPTVFMMVENKLGISILPASLMNTSSGVKFIELKELTTTKLFAIWNKENENPILPDVIELL